MALSRDLMQSNAKIYTTYNLISILMSARYNYAFLARTLDSITMQIRIMCELTAVNDYSADGIVICSVDGPRKISLTLKEYNRYYSFAEFLYCRIRVWLCIGYIQRPMQERDGGRSDECLIH